MPMRPAKGALGARGITTAAVIERALPPPARTKDCTVPLQSIVERRGLGGTARGTVLLRIGDAVFVLVSLERLGERVTPVGEGQVTPAVEWPDIPVRLTVHHPLG